MKRWFFALMLLMFAVAPGAFANDFCTDCATKWVGGRADAICCMGTANDTCYGGYSVEEWNLGASCIIEEGELGEYCSSNGLDPGCDLGDDPCVYQGGYCPPSCSSCREPI